MKTITEFSGFTLKEAINKKAALLTEGKTEEEAQTAINEQLKLADETKVTFYKNAVDMCKSRIDQVKRVVVAVKSSDTEKVPEAFSEREGNFYLVEYFAQAGSMNRGRHDDRDERGGRGDRGRGNDRGRGGDRPPRGDKPFGDRPPRGDRPAFNAAAGEGKPQGERRPRPPRGDRPANAPRGPRPERKPRENQGPKGAAELRLVLKGQNQANLQGSGTVEAATTPDTQQG